MSAGSKALPITVEQYEGFAGYPGLKDELIFGKIILSPQPKPRHQQIGENVHRLLADVVERYGYVAKQNSNLKFPGANSMPAPDVFVVPGEVWQEACRADHYVSVPPVVVAEIVSPPNRRSTLASKVRLYLENGVELVLEVRPKSRLVTCCTQTAPPLVLGDEDRVTLPNAVGGSLPVAEISSFDPGQISIRRSV